MTMTERHVMVDLEVPPPPSWPDGEPVGRGVTARPVPHHPGLIFLASPYSNPQVRIEEQNYRDACRATAHFIAQGWIVFSPIVHCHPMAVKYVLPKDADYWARYNRTMIARSTEVWVLRLPGWEQSKGVQTEMVLARSLGLPIRHVGYPSLTYVEET